MVDVCRAGGTWAEIRPAPPSILPQWCLAGLVSRVGFPRNKTLKLRLVGRKLIGTSIPVGE